MKVRGQHFRTIWLNPDDERVVRLIDQRFLPYRFRSRGGPQRRRNGNRDQRKCMFEEPG